MSNTRVVISIGDLRLAATLQDSATTQALLTRLPLSVEMLDLYDHELVHRFGEPLPTTSLITGTPRRGDIVYWTPRNALAIFYDDGEELCDLQPVGRVDAGIDQIDRPGDSTVTFVNAAG